MTTTTDLHLLSDGSIKMDGGAVFGQVPKSQWQTWLPADRRNRVRLGMNCLLVRMGNQNFLIDTGCGQKHSPARRDTYGLATSQLLQELKAHGIQPQDIHGVVLTSLRFEHIGGATRRDRSGALAPAFPKAKYYVQKAALEEALSPSERETDGYCPEDFLPLQERGHLQVLDDSCQIAPGIQVRRTNGPSDGHQIVIISHGGERVAFLGDLMPTPYHLQMACISATDRRPEETLALKREVLAEATRNGWLLVFSHGLTDRAGYLENRNGRSHLRPVNLK